MLKIERMFAILIRLLHRKVITAEELAFEFKVSKRTIYRDMDSLSFAGIPVVSLSGNKGGFTLMENYQLTHFTFTEAEKRQLLTGLKLQEELLQSKELSELMNKVTLLTTEHETTEVPISITAATQHRPEIDLFVKEKLEQILQALECQKKLSIRYVSGNGESTTRSIQPQEVRFINGSWYVDAYCYLRNEERQFKLTRMLELSLLDTDEPIATLTKSTVTVMEEDSKKEKAILIFKERALGKLLDYFVEEEWQELADGQIQVTFLLERNRDYVAFLLMFGQEVQIIEPQWLHEAWRNEVLAMLHLES